MKRNLITVAIGILLAAVFCSQLFVFQVRENEVAIVTTFGKIGKPLGPGPHLRWPWPIQRVYKLDRRVQMFEDKFTEDLTADNNNLLTQVYLGWRIADPGAFFPRFPGGSTAAAERMLEGIVRSVKSGVVGRYALSDFVNADPGQLKLAQIEAEIQQAVQAQLEMNKCGIEVVFLGIKRLGLPESVTQAVFERMRSERNVLSSRSEYEGEAEAQKIRSAAERQAAEVIAAAEARAKEIRAEGEAEAAQILPVFQRNPELATFLLRLDALEQSLKERATLILDQQTPPFDLFGGAWTNRPNR